eukprot:7751594-Pyramimonas_sp.AAC.1
MYGYTGIGCTGLNIQLLEDMGKFLEQLKTPWAPGGDLNIDTSDPGLLGWCTLVGGTSIAPKAPTCHKQTLDYFIVSRGVAAAVTSVSALFAGPSSPHVPVLMELGFSP